MRESLKEQIKSRILAETAQLMGDYRDDGIEELRHDIREHTKVNHTNRLLYALKRQDGKSVFDDIAHFDGKGWHIITHPQNNDMLIYVTTLKDGYSLYVGSDLDDIQKMEKALFNNGLVVFIMTISLSVIGGMIISRRFLKRVDKVNRTTELIGRGTLAARLPVSKANDDFDQLSLTINQMLDRIELLVSEVKNVSTCIAHDMRTPLGHLRQKIEQLLPELSSPKAEQLHQDALMLLDEILSSFSSLLQIAEIEAGSVSVTYSSFPLTPVLKKLEETYAVIAEDNMQNLSMECDDKVILYADKSLIIQMLVNLIENAIKHSGQGTQIILSARHFSDGVMIEVKDNGIGIPPNMYESILKPFFRGDKSRSTKGAGLGLSLVRSIASLHQADLKLSNYHSGLCVAIFFSKPNNG